MSNNSKKIKKMFEREFDIEIMKKEILSREREKKMNLKSALKWGFVPTCLVAVICGVLLFGGNKEMKPNTHEPNIEHKDNISMFINDISNISQGALRVDADVKILNGVYVPYFEELSNIKIPDDFDNKDNVHAIYVKPNKDSNEYNTLQNYVFNYSNTKNERNITIAFSKENKPIRDYYFSEEGSKVSKINDIELKIFKYDELFFTEFNYKGINFDIETTGITEQELTNLLLSIIK